MYVKYVNGFILRLLQILRAVNDSDFTKDNIIKHYLKREREIGEGKREGERMINIRNIIKIYLKRTQ